MDLLVIDPIDADVMRWLGSRHQLRFVPDLAFAPRDFRRALYNVRAAIVPASVSIDAETLDFAPVLRAVGRVSAGSENIDLEACEKRKVEVVRSVTASARAEAEFVVGAMLSLFRRVPVRGSDGSMAGRELGGATIGLVGMPPAARTMVQLLAGFGVRILGYDPALHARDPAWAQWQVTHSGCASWSSAPTCCACSSTTSAAITACSATGSCATANRTRWSSAPLIRVSSTKWRWPRR